MVTLSITGYGSVSEGMSSTGVEAISSRYFEGVIEVKLSSYLLMRSATVSLTA